MKHNGKKRKENNMKKIFFAMSCLLATLLISSCGNDLEETVKGEWYKFEDLTFDVSVNGKSGFGSDTRAYSNKTGWTDGDVIYFSVDGNDNNACRMIYSANGQWTVEKLSENVSFANDNGKLSAVYAEKSSYGTDGITTSGDILYTTSGTYEKSGNAVHVSLDMSNRPLSRITINGIGSGFTLCGKSFSGVLSISNSKLTESSGIAAYDVTGQKATYFGLIESNTDNTTTVTLVDETTAVEYYRTYNKQMNAGEAIVINGPLSSESAEWTKIVGVTSLALDKSDLTMIVGEDADVTATILPENATNKNLQWKISDSDIATITITDNVCHVKALMKGDVTITVETESGAKVATCMVHVKEVSDLVKAMVTSSAITNLSGYKYVTFGVTITNNLTSSIVLTNMKMTNGETGSVLVNGLFEEKDATLTTGESKTFSMRKNGTYASLFSFIITFTYKGASYTIECNYDTDK